MTDSDYVKLQLELERTCRTIGMLELELMRHKEKSLALQRQIDSRLTGEQDGTEDVNDRSKGKGDAATETPGLKGKARPED